MNSLYDVWKNNTNLGDTKWSVSGTSIAGIRTAFLLPELKIQLDAGYQSFTKVSDIFITHSHADHIASLPLIILENISNKIVTNVYCPKESKTFIEKMLVSFIMCNYNNNQIPKKYFKIIPLDNKYSIELKLNNQNIKIKLFESCHTVPTLSYGFIDVKKKLKNEYKDLKGEEIVNLKKKGIIVTENVDYKKLVFCGDTSIDIFKDLSIFEFENIIIECTFFDDEDLKIAVDRKHMHWSLLKEVIIKYPKINFYLIHISAKYHNLNKINEYIEGIENVFIL